MEYQGEEMASFVGHGQMAGAAWDIVLRGDPVDILKSKPILDLVELPDIPCNPLLVKGMVLRPGGHVPLVDARMQFSFGLPGRTGKACALIVDIGGVEVGLIVGEIMVA